MTDTRPVFAGVDLSLEFQVQQAFDTWLATLPENTAIAYRGSWASLMKQSMKTPGEMKRSDVAKWVEVLKSAGKSAATLNLRLAGISSFYQYLSESYNITLDNPAAGTSLRQKVYRWSGAHFLDQESAKKFLDVFDRSTVQGSRDRALFMAYLMTGRRSAEIRFLHWNDIAFSEGKVWYRWHGKGKSRKDLMPDPVFDAIANYLTISGRIDTIKPADFIFISTQSKSADQCPLSATQVCRLLNKYLQAAGFSGHIRVHDLRHTAAMLHKAAGEDIESIQELLNHSNVNTTLTYLHALEGHTDSAWRAVGQMLGIDCEEKDIHESRVPLRDA